VTVGYDLPVDVASSARDLGQLTRLKPPHTWRGRVRGRLGFRPRQFKAILGIACTGHGASLALVTADGLVRSSVLDRWAGVKHVLLLSHDEDHDLRGWPYPVPVGCYPAGASAVGALDMAGNIWEWTSDLWQTGEEAVQQSSEGQKRALRGGGYLSKKSQTLVTARIGLAPGASFDNGFRVLLENDV